MLTTPTVAAALVVRDLGISRNTVRKALRSEETSFVYGRDTQPLPKLGPWSKKLEDLRGLGYEGGYDAVRRYARKWRDGQGALTAAAYVPLGFDPGEVYHFDWGHEIVLLDGVTTIGREGRPHASVPQPNDLRSRLSPRDAGDGFRRA